MRRRVTDFAIAIAALIAAVLLRWLLDPVIGDTLPLVTLFGAVAGAVWIAGYPAAVFVTLAGYVACAILFIEPRGQLGLDRVENLVGFVAYLFTCALIIAVGETMRWARRQAAARGELLRVTLGSIGDAVITTDSEARVTYLNAVAESLTGWTSRDAFHQPLDTVFRIVREDNQKPAENPALRALREGTIVGLANHTLLIAKDNSVRAIDDSAAPIRNEQGSVSGCVLIFRDISERRRLEREKADRLVTARTLAAIVESSDDAIVSKSLEGVIQSWNAAAERIFGYTAEQAVGRHITLIIPPDRIEEEDRIIASLKAGQRIEHFETERVRNDGRRIWIALTVSPIFDGSGRVIGASKIARDVTHQREVEAERKRLEESLRKLAADLSDADRRKDEFLATLSHELRNPLAPMHNMLEYLKRSGADGDALPRAVEMMERQLGHLVRLVDDLMDVSRITHNRLELRKARIELQNVIRQAVQAASPLVDAGGHKLSVSLPDEPVMLYGDAVRLTQVFGNLLNNSCRYTPRGGRITVTVQRSGSDAVVTIADTGTGIPSDKLETIFDMFTQVDRSLERSQGGLGVGLTLVKRLVEMHGGAVEARSAGEGHGSEFIVRLPIAADVPRVATPTGIR